MSSRYRRREEVRITLPRGDWILVKNYLTAGETREAVKRATPKGEREVDPMALALAKMVAYLVDWSLTDVDEQPIIIREQPAAFVSDALDNLPVDDWVELLNAVTAHERTMERDRDDEKKTGTGNSKSEATSPLPESLVGATNGSPN